MTGGRIEVTVKISGYSPHAKSVTAEFSQGVKYASEVDAVANRVASLIREVGGANESRR